MSAISPLDVVLDTSRLILRPLRPDDAPAIFAMYSEVQVMRYWTGAPWTDPARAEEYVATSAQDIAAGTAMRLGVEVKASGQCVGQVTLFHFDVQNRRCDLGYALNRDHWGQGYVGEALHALLDFGFGALGLHRVEADIDPRNTASLRTAERLGFVREGLLRERWLVAGEICDTAIYGLLAREWEQQKEHR
ncbi:MAG: GNAT family N-acetyltransferase [Massilia sp.]